MPGQSPVIVVVGPTSAGKSALAVAVAEWFGGEVISADAFQVYRGLDIGTGKNEVLDTKVSGGVVGIILDGRGRQPFNLTENTENRVSQLKEWSEETDEYPQLENSNV